MNKYWFRKRQGLDSQDYGWGWRPATWEGWTLAIVLVVSVFASAFAFFGESILTNVDPPFTTVLSYIGVVIALIVTTAFIAYKKTPR